MEVAHLINTLFLGHINSKVEHSSHYRLGIASIPNEARGQIWSSDIELKVELDMSSLN